MRTRPSITVLSVLVATLVGFPAGGQGVQTLPSATPSYASDGQLVRPADYREWIYLSSGFDMSYNPSLKMGHHMFDNVFVNPEAYRAFQKTGVWPDKTVLVLEGRGAQGKGSINQVGQYQSGEPMALEIHVRDDARFSGRWAFFAFSDGKTATMIPQSADCYACHRAHGAVDTTFVQFYPTMLPIAKSKGVLSEQYLKDEVGARNRREE